MSILKEFVKHTIREQNEKREEPFDSESVYSTLQQASTKIRSMSEVEKTEVVKARDGEEIRLIIETTKDWATDIRLAGAAETYGLRRMTIRLNRAYDTEGRGWSAKIRQGYMAFDTPAYVRSMTATRERQHRSMTSRWKWGNTPREALERAREDFYFREYRKDLRTITVTEKGKYESKIEDLTDSIAQAISSEM